MDEETNTPHIPKRGIIIKNQPVGAFCKNKHKFFYPKGTSPVCPYCLMEKLDNIDKLVEEKIRKMDLAQFSVVDAVERMEDEHKDIIISELAATITRAVREGKIEINLSNLGGDMPIKERLDASLMICDDKEFQRLLEDEWVYWFPNVKTVQEAEDMLSINDPNDTSVPDSIYVETNFGKQGVQKMFNRYGVPNQVFKIFKVFSKVLANYYIRIKLDNIT